MGSKVVCLVATGFWGRLWTKGGPDERHFKEIMIPLPEHCFEDSSKFKREVERLFRRIRLQGSKMNCNCSPAARCYETHL